MHVLKSADPNVLDAAKKDITNLLSSECKFVSSATVNCREGKMRQTMYAVKGMIKEDRLETTRFESAFALRTLHWNGGGR